MKKLFTLISLACLSVFSTQAQCDLDFTFTNTGTNMTAFFTPTVATSIYTDLGAGTVGAFFTNADGDYVCAASSEFTGSQIQLAVMADDATTPVKDGFSVNESISWFYQTSGGTVHSLDLTPADNFLINGMTFISDAIISDVDCGGTSTGDECPPLDTDFVNTGANMTLFITPDAATDLSALGNGTVAVYFNNGGEEVCGGSTAFAGESAQIAANGDDATTPEQDGFLAAESIVWKFEDNSGNQYVLTPNPVDAFSLNGISFVTGVTYQAISCAVDVEGCTDPMYVEYNSNATIDDGSCVTIAVLGCTDANYLEYNPEANVNDGSCSILSVEGCMDDAYLEFNPNATVDDGSCVTIVVLGCTDANYLEYNSEANVDDGSCSILSVEGCTDDAYLEYNSNATIDDGSCLTIAVLGCTDADYLEYNSEANVDDGSCSILSVDGCMDAAYLEFNPNATVDDGSCLTIAVSGCTDQNYMEYNTAANVDDGSCVTLIVEGCTNAAYVEYDEEANVDNGSCSVLVVYGCIDANASNYDSSANTSDGSCEYDLIGAGCSVEFDATNTGSNHTIMVPSTATNMLNVGDQIGVFYISESGEAVCAGSSLWTGQTMQIVAFGDDATTVEVDGLVNGAPFLYLAQSGDNVYMVTAEYSNGTSDAYVVNGLSFIASFDFELACTVEYLGCTDVNACNYEETANTDDGTCNYADAYLDCSGNCLSDVDSDGVCDEFEVYGCTDSEMSNYDANATEEDGSCVTWEEAYNDCITSGGDDGVTQADVDAVQDLLNEANLNLSTAQANVLLLEADLANALANQEDGITQIDLDALQSELDAANIQLTNAESNIVDLEAQLEIALANQEDGVTQADLDAANATIASLDAQIEDLLISCGDDGVTQADVDAVQALLDEANASLVIANDNNADLQTQLTEALSNQEDGITQADVDAVQADLNAANIQVADLQVQLEEALASGGGTGSCDPIYIELLEGWNIIGYTLNYQQDVAATLADIVDQVQIVKNNSAAVYWPEYGFNGIGNFIPGQGYQIRMHTALASYTFPDVNGQRIEMTPTVPQWVHDLPVLTHPNDVRSLVKVVNMLGQEVNPAEEFKGEVLLYLYNDGTTEKRVK